MPKSEHATVPAKTEPTAAEMWAAQKRTPAERAIIEGYIERRKSQPAPSRVKVHQSGDVVSVEMGSGDVQIEKMKMMLAFGTTDESLLNGLLSNIVNVAMSGGKVSDAEVNFIISFVAGIEPKDPIEAMLAIQMAAIHKATVSTARVLEHADDIPQLELHERTLNKLARTFTTQMEALKRYRTGGQQKVVVEHVTVNAGGQAIVGAVEHAGGGAAKKQGATS